MSRRYQQCCNCFMKNSNVQNNFETNHIVQYELIGQLSPCRSLMKEAIKPLKVNCLWWSALAVTVCTFVPTVWSQRLWNNQNVMWNWQSLKTQKKRKENYMYQTYKLVAEVYCQNATLWQVLQYLTQLCSLYDVHLTYNNKDSGVPMNVSKCFNNFSGFVNKEQH